LVEKGYKVPKMYNASTWGGASDKDHHLYQTGRTGVLGATQHYKKAWTHRCRGKCVVRRAKAAAKHAKAVEAIKLKAKSLKKAANDANKSAKHHRSKRGKHPVARLVNGQRPGCSKGAIFKRNEAWRKATIKKNHKLAAAAKAKAMKIKLAKAKASAAKAKAALAKKNADAKKAKKAALAKKHAAAKKAKKAAHAKKHAAAKKTKKTYL